MTIKDSLGDRMKENYENRYRIFLTRRTPVIIRLDGKAFHTFTKGMRKPFDVIISRAMFDTTKYLCENIMGCQIGYTQSDEISLLLIDYKKLTSQAWFDYNLQKICSVAASMATKAFNKAFVNCVDHYQFNFGTDKIMRDYCSPEETYKYVPKKLEAEFDARAFNIPADEVCNYFIWRQQDATRNSIESLGHCYFTQKELHKKNCSQIQDMLIEQKQINWNNEPTFFKRGSAVRKYTREENGVTRSYWATDMETPIFAQERSYIEDLLKPEED